MASPLITTASTLTCPHGGTVAIVSANAKVAAAAMLALATDTFTISGCPFQIPIGTGSVPHPCVTVKWLKPNKQTLVNGTPTLSGDSKSVCLAADLVPQGPVSVVAVQSGVTGS